MKAHSDPPKNRNPELCLKIISKSPGRNLLKNKFYSAINITGLAGGLAVGIMILLWVQDEFSYDRFHANAANIYKVNAHLGKGSDASVWEGVPAPIAVFCKQSIPDVVNAVRLDNVNVKMELSYKDKEIYGSKIACVDSTFFSVFDFRLLQGDVTKPFPYINSIIISASEARRIFGSEKDAAGKVLATDLGKILGTDLASFTVSGVMQDFPENSTLQYNILLPMTLDADYFARSGGTEIGKRWMKIWAILVSRATCNCRKGLQRM